jgi:sugar lactone lactonase YvrE
MTVFDPRPCLLGEGPIWHPERKQFFWFDILGQRLLSQNAAGAQEWQFDRIASAAGWVDRDHLLVGTETGLALLDLRDGDLQMIAGIEQDRPATRSNDGRADRQGGFWLGTMGKQPQKGAGSIYRYYRGELRRLFDGITIPNAICFSPDGGTGYFADTDLGKVWTVALDARGWPDGPPALWKDFAEIGLNPDGAVIDAEGAICVACWGAGKVMRFSPDGQLLDEFTVGGVHSSCPAHGGEDLRDLLVTTAREGLDSPDAAQGLPYLLRVPVAGLPEPRVIL